MAALSKEQRHRIVAAIGALQTHVGQVDQAGLSDDVEILAMGTLEEAHAHGVDVAAEWRQAAFVRSGETVASLHDLLPRLRRLAQSGVAVHAVFDADSMPPPAIHQVLAEDHREYRLTFAPMSMTIGEGRTVLMVGETPRGEWSLRGFTSPAVVTAAIDYWNAVSDIPAAAAGAVPPSEGTASLTERQVRILRLLSAGHTDEHIAHQLEVSVRTVRADVRCAMDHYGATSRFEAGCAFTAAGLLPG